MLNPRQKRIVSEDQLLHRLQRMPEGTLIDRVLVPLIRAMGFDTVENNHGPLDRGKDILALKADAFGNKELTVVSVKRLKFSGRASRSTHLTNVCTQLTQCIEEPVRMKDGEERYASEVWFVSPYPLSQSSLESSFVSYSKALRRRIKIIDGPTVISILRTKSPHLLGLLGDTLTVYLNNIRAQVPLLYEASALNLKEPVRLERFYIDLDYILAGDSGEVSILAVDGRSDVSVVGLNLDDVKALVEFDRKFRGILGVGIFRTIAVRRHVEKALGTGKVESGALRENQPHIDARKGIQQLKHEYSYLLRKVGRWLQVGSPISSKDDALEELMQWVEKTDPLMQGKELRLIVKRTARPTSFDREKLRVRLNDLVDRGKNLVIAGDAGSGKTTLLRMTAARLATGGNRIPIYMPLASVSDPEALDVELCRVCSAYGYNIGIPTLRELLRQGRVVILLDGLDEVIRKFQHIGKRIGELTRRFRNCQVIVSARPWAKTYLPGRFLRIDLQPFSDDQLSDFFAHWFKESPRYYQSVMAHVERNTGIREAARTPLVASILASLQNAGGRLPTSLTGVYREVFRLLLHDWSMVKGISRDVYDLLEKQRFLQKLAFTLHERGAVSGSWQSLKQMVSKHVGNVVAPDQVDTFLTELVESNNVLHQRNDGSWGFAHLQYQEYLAAVELIENSAAPVVDKIGIEWWNDALTMYAELRQDVTGIIQHFMKTGKLRFHLRQLERMASKAPHTSLEMSKLVEFEGAAAGIT